MEGGKTSKYSCGGGVFTLPVSEDHVVYLTGFPFTIFRILTMLRSQR